MLKLFKKHRRSYSGEDIVSERALTDGIWETTTEFVPNNVINNQISNKAVVLGNGWSRSTFNVRHMLAHRSGLLGADTLQSYACNGFYRDFTPDFLIVTDRRIAKEVADSNFTDNNIAYTRVDISLEFPRKFYLIPHDPYADAGATALYIAAFDGHKKIFMLGFDGQDTPNINNNIYAGTNGYDPKEFDISDSKWVDNASTVFKTYNDVDFVWVTPGGRNNVPEIWKHCTNLRQISMRDMVLEADL